MNRLIQLFQGFIFLIGFILSFLWQAIYDEWYYSVRASDQGAANYPVSLFLPEITFSGNKRNLARGSDNWPITWAADDNQYTTFGDGGGFDESTKVSFGVARISGSKDNYLPIDIYESPSDLSGKIYGILGVNGILYFLKCGDGSELSNFKYVRLYKAEIPTGDLLDLVDTGVQFTPPVENFFCPSFLQFGRDYAGALDNYVYIYAPEISQQVWNVQYPGKISLLRVSKDQLENKASYEYFSGMNGGEPTWSADVSQRQPVFSFDSSCLECSDSGVMRTSVSYNFALGRYLLITQQVDRLQSSNGHIGIYDAPAPWGPWTTVLFKNAWDPSLGGLMTSRAIRTVYFNFSNKWSNGNNFVLVYTDHDRWATIEGYFTTVAASPTPVGSPSPTLSPSPTEFPTDSPTPEFSPSPTFTNTASPTDLPTPDETATPTQTLTFTLSPTGSPTPTDTFTPDPSPMFTSTESITSTPTETDSPVPSTLTPIPTQTSTPLPTDTPTESISPTATPAPTSTYTSTPTPSPTFNSTPTPSGTPTPEDTPTPTHSSTPTPTDSPTPSLTPGPSPDPTSTDSPIPTITPTSAPTDTPTPTPTDTPTPSFTPTETPTSTPSETSIPTYTDSPSPTSLPTETFTSTPTETPTPTPTETPSSTYTASPTLTPSESPTLSVTPSPVLTEIPTPTPSNTFTPTPTDSPTPSSIPTETFTSTPTDTPTPTPADTPTPSPTSTSTPTDTSTTTPTDSPTPSSIPTETPSPTSMETSLPTPTNSPTPTPTETPSPTSTETSLPTPTDTPTPTPTQHISPVVSFSSPVQDETVAGNVTIQLSASDDIGVAYVEIYIDEEMLGSDFDLPFEFIWNSTPVSNGYHYLMAKAYDTAGNSGTDTVSINVQNGDLEPPTAPTDLATTAVSSNQVDLNWTASIDNLGVVGYDVFRNGVQISTTEITSFSDTGLIASTTYTYFVVAKDAAGNQSTASNAFEVTTLEAPLYGSLAGTVYSTSGGVISNVRVSITVQKTLITGFTDLAGQYMIMGLPPGTYSVKYIPPTGDHLQSTVQLNIQAGFTTVQNVTLKKKNSRS